MRVFPRDVCGLTEEINYFDWRTYLYRQSLTSKCRSGSETGRWLVPCNHCDNSSSCYWQEAKWDPFQCHYPVLSQKRLSSCLTNKKVFIYLIHNFFTTNKKLNKFCFDLRFYLSATQPIEE